jgi:DNA-binding SARP family transcriptional activator
LPFTPATSTGVADGDRRTIPGVVGDGDDVGRFAVLGPLAVTDREGRPVALRSSARRRLLALLLIHPGEVQLADRLIDQVWYEDPPLNRGAFHVQVSRLRKELSEEGGLSPIVTEPGGYRLQVATDEIDWLRFVRLIEAARADSDPSSAVDRYAAALALWRGEAFADLLGPPDIDEHARHLDLLHRAARLEHAALLGRLGRHRDVIARLDPLHHAEPFDESVAEALARALADAGQRDRAIDVVEVTERAFREQLGLDPPAAIAELHLQLLEPGRLTPIGVASSAWAGAAGSPDSTAPDPVPALPLSSASQRLLGRGGELRDLVEAAKDSDGPRCLALVGPSGIGKTTVAVEVATRLRSAGRHVRFASCAASPTLVGNGLRSMFADLLGAQPPTRSRSGDRITSAEVALILAAAIADGLDSGGATGPLVLVIDDLHLADDVDARTLRALLQRPGSAWFPVVLTTTRTADALVGIEAEAIALSNLTAEEIAPALARPELAATVAELTGGHPFAVARVLDALDEVDPEDQAEALARLRDPSAPARTWDDPRRRSSPTAHAALQLLAVADGPVDAVTLTAALGDRSGGGGADAAAAAIVELIDDGLVVERSDGSLSIAHELLGADVRRHLDADVLRRLERRLLAATSAHDPWVPTNAHLLAAADERRTQLLDAARAAAQLGAFGEAERIAAIVLDTSTSPADRVGALLIVGECQAGLADDVGARTAFEEAFDLAEVEGDQTGLASALTGLLGGWYAGVGPSAEQVDRIDRALVAITDPVPRTIALARAIGAHLGGDPRCRPWADEAVALAERSGDPRASAAATFAHSQANLGWPGAALRYERTGAAARAAAIEIGYDRYAALIAHHLVASVEVGDLDAARWCTERQGWIAEVTRRPLHAWRAQVLIATVAMAAASVPAAEQAVDAAAAIARAHRLTDGRMTELLQRAVLRCWGSEVDPLDHGYRPLGTAVPHALSHALDAVVLAEADPPAARASLAAAVDASVDLPNDYLRWSTLAAVHAAAIRLGDDPVAGALRTTLADADVRCAVLAVGTAALPMP